MTTGLPDLHSLQEHIHRQAVAELMGTYDPPRVAAETPEPENTRCSRRTAWWRQPWKSTKSMATVLTSPKLSDVEHERHMQLCRECPDSTAQGDKLFCGCCGCGTHRLADLHIKNRYSAHHCPGTPAAF